MSALVNETPIVNWKDSENTFTQISSAIKYNNPSTSTNKSSYFRALPLKIYRKEIVTDTAVGNPRTSGRIFDFDRPGGTITTNREECVGIKNTQIINNSADKVCRSETEKCSVFLSAEANARARVRSSGMIRKKYSADTAAPNYFTDTKQYLESRSLSYKSNSNFHVFSGDVTSTAGSAEASQNIYTASSGDNCKKEFLSVAGSFNYKWLDGSVHAVVIPIGNYDVSDLNRILHTTMANNYHYYVDSPTDIKIFLLSLKYSQNDGMIVVEALGVNKETTATYVKPISGDPASAPTWDDTIPTNSPDSKNIQLEFNITGSLDNAELYSKMGVNVITDPLSIPGTPNGPLGKIEEITGSKTAFYPRKKIVYYKPSNPGFATQGAVSSSDLITRRKYNTINTVAGSMRSAYGNHTASAVAYGVPAYGYTKKDKIGYPMKQTPTFSKYSNIMKKCSVRKFANAI